jgi:acetate kinase
MSVLSADYASPAWFDASVARKSAICHGRCARLRRMPTVLTLNGGSSSIRFALYDADNATTKLLDGKIDRIGVSGTCMNVAGMRTPIDGVGHQSVVDFLMTWLGSQTFFPHLAAVGHRIVHGMRHSSPERITPTLLAELRRIVPYDPEHLPRELELIDAVGRVHPHLAQVACFDTAFHRSMPPVATMLPIPRRFLAKGVQRYGFHGLSYTYLMAELARLGDPAAASGRVILAHLGNGASLAAVRAGGCIDTSMGFTPTSGLVMSTRSGDLDPGIVNFLASTEAMDAPGFQRMVTQESGLLGVSETSSDIRDLLAREALDVRAAEAVALFCYQAKKWIGAFAAALGGVDTLVFAGGIGENAVSIRARICAGLEFLGIELDPARNSQGAAIVSNGARSVAVRVVRTDEEAVIAAMTLRVLSLDPAKEP